MSRWQDQPGFSGGHVRCPTCLSVYDDAVMDTTCHGRGPDEPYGHYPLGSGPAGFCKTHDLYRPCAICDVPRPVRPSPMIGSP